MIYDVIEADKISIGEPRIAFDDDNKTLTEVFYNGSALEFTKRNRYVTIKGIETNKYNKRTVSIKSIEFGKIICDIVDALAKLTTLPITPPVQSKGWFKASVNNATRFFDMELKTPLSTNLAGSEFEACIALAVPTFFSDGNRITVQIVLKDVAVRPIKDISFDIDPSKLKAAE
jgi:hypothetical protein